MEARLIARMGWRPAGLSEQSPLLSSPAPSKTRRMESTTNDIGCNPMGAPTCLREQEVGKPSRNAAQHCAKADGCVNDDPCRRRDALREGWGFRVGTWNADSLTRRAGELVEVLPDRKVDVACVQETRWKGSGCRLFGARGKRYNLFWMGGKEKSDGVGIFVAEKWVDSVVSVERCSERVMILKLVIDSVLLNIFLQYIRLIQGNRRRKKKSF